MEKRRVVITGMGTVNPIGNSVAESWQAVKDGKCGIGPITRYDCSDMRVKLAGEVKDLDIDSVLGKREAKKMDRFTQFALIAAQQAMDDSGLDREGEDLSRCGVICSSGIGGFETVSEAHRRGESRGYDSVSPFVIPMIISNMAAGVLPKKLSEEEVIAAGEAAKDRFSALVLACLEHLDEAGEG